MTSSKKEKDDQCLAPRLFREPPVIPRTKRNAKNQKLVCYPLYNYFVLLALLLLVPPLNADEPATCPFTGRENFAYKGTCHHVQLAVRINAYATLKPFTIANAPDLIDTDATYSAKGFTVTATPSVTFIRAQGGTSGITIPGDGSWGGWWVYFLRRKNC
eukprot:PhM_4_TR10013/c2_g1_i1/m.34885